MSKKEGTKKSFRDFQEDFVVLLEEGFRSAGRITKREFDRVSDKVKQRLENKYGKEKVEDFTSRVRSDWQQVIDKMNQARQKLETEESIRKGKEIGVQILDGLSSAMKRAAENLEASLSDKVTYHSGQVIDKGVYLCVRCRKIQEVKRRRRLSACKECEGSEFRQA